MEKNTDLMDVYFKTEQHKIIFALMYTDTSLRERLLGISKELYLDKERAKEWRNDILKKIHPDICKIAGADEAVKSINELYFRMIAEDEGDGDCDE